MDVDGHSLDGPAPMTSVGGPIDWLDDPAPARRAAWACLVAQQGGGSDRETIGQALDELVRGFEPRQWFIAKRGVIYGSSALLRALVAHAGAEDEGGSLRVYTREVLERLLRHVEVRRADALRLAGGAPSDAVQAIERARFTIALLEGSRLEGDLRLLNAAMKRNDLQLTALTPRARARDATWWLEVAHHAECLALQERCFEEAFGA
jgi:hypothetical protein